MPTEYLHERKDFPELLQIIGKEMNIQAQLIEKDYWIMHVLYGLKKQGFTFELKGGTSLSKGYHIIDRFSEDIDIHVTPAADQNVEENPKKNNAKSIKSRKDFYDTLAKEISIDGIVSVERDTAFDNERTYLSGGIRLIYQSQTDKIEGLKDGILLEAGFDTVSPNNPLTISSWAYDRAAAIESIKIIDNRAVDIACYHPGYTFVEKLQTIATKFRQEQTDGKARPNLMRQYYDVYSLLDHEQVQQFIGTDAYHTHKENRFHKQDYAIPIAENEAFLLSSKQLRAQFRKRYEDTATLYHAGQPDFDVLIARIQEFAYRL
jgi:predicted nucleotidyltransferase component of viral defense system